MNVNMYAVGITNDSRNKLQKKRQYDGYIWKKFDI